MVSQGMSGFDAGRCVELSDWGEGEGERYRGGARYGSAVDACARFLVLQDTREAGRAIDYEAAAIPKASAAGGPRGPTMSDEYLALRSALRRLERAPIPRQHLAQWVHHRLALPYQADPDALEKSARRAQNDHSFRDRLRGVDAALMFILDELGMAGDTPEWM